MADNQTPLVPGEAAPPPHDCDHHSRYTFGPMGWGWYCDLCGAFAPMDDIHGE